MRALVSRSMKKKFRKTFPDWNTCNSDNAIYYVGAMVYGRTECFYWLMSDVFTEEQKRFFAENNIRTEEI